MRGCGRLLIGRGLGCGGLVTRSWLLCSSSGLLSGGRLGDADSGLFGGLFSGFFLGFFPGETLLFGFLFLLFFFFAFFFLFGDALGFGGLVFLVGDLVFLEEFKIGVGEAIFDGNLVGFHGFGVESAVGDVKMEGGS